MSSEDDSLSPPRPFFLADDPEDADAPRRNRRRRSQLAHDDGTPPSAYAFQDSPGRVSRRGSAESIRMVRRSPRTDTPRPPEGLPLPHPPFLYNAPYRSSSGSLSNTTLYRSSAAAALSDIGSPTVPRNSFATTATFRSPFLSPASRPSSTWSPPTPSALFNVPSHANSTTALPLPQVLKKAMPSTRLREKLKDDDKPWLALKPTVLERASKWVTLACLFIGIGIAAILVFRGTQTVHLLRDSQLCVVLDEQFSDSSLDTSTWSYDVELGGFGNGEFEMTTNSPNNVYISNGQLFIMPTLTSDTISGGYTSVMDGATYSLDGCTAANNGTGPVDQGAWVVPPFLKRQDNSTYTYNTTYAGGDNSTTPTNSTTPSNSTTSSNSTSSSSSGGGTNACTAVSSSQAGTVINPVMSGRINTRGKKSIKYGKVEISAKLPQGDWLWPAIWMLPEGNSTSTAQGTGVYGAWPVSGEIDIMEARGNLPSYPAQGSNYVRSTLNYGPFASGTTPISIGSTTIANLLKSLYGWVNTKRGNFASDFHVYAMEWTDSWMRFYTDNRLQAMINLDISSKNTDSYFFNVGGFPTVAMNTSSGTYIEIQDPWSTAYGGTAAAPFDQQFYLVIDLAAGGTSGWFPDNVGGKPWYDGSSTAMRDFASAQSTWSATWPSSADNRAFRIDYVKMYQLC